MIIFFFRFVVPFNLIVSMGLNCNAACPDSIACRTTLRNKVRTFAFCDPAKGRELIHVCTWRPLIESTSTSLYAR